MKIGFIGAGAMAEALVKGLLASGSYCSDDLCASDISKSRLSYFEATYQVMVHKDNSSIVRDADIVVLAVKPDKARGVIQEIRDSLKDGQMLISLAAGVTTVAIEAWASRDIPVVRVMPNTPALIGQGVSALAAGRYCNAEHLDATMSILDCVGETVVVPENLMNAVTGVSGSGPAYIYLVIEAMIDGAVTLGLPRDVAGKLVVQTVAGSAEMVRQTGMHPAVLKAQVTSPGGTTAAGLNELEDGRLRAILAKAVKAAAQRADEIGN